MSEVEETRRQQYHGTLVKPRIYFVSRKCRRLGGRAGWRRTAICFCFMDRFLKGYENFYFFRGTCILCVRVCFVCSAGSSRTTSLLDGAPY